MLQPFICVALLLAYGALGCLVYLGLRFVWLLGSLFVAGVRNALRGRHV